MGIDHQQLHRYATAQGGVVSVEQIDLCGGSRAMVRRRVRSGEWESVLPKVVAIGGGCDGLGRVHAAMLWAGAGSVLVGAAALWWWRVVPDLPRTVSVVLPEHRPRPSRAFVAVRRFGVPAEDRVTERGIRVVSKPYAVLFAGRERTDARALLDRALLRGGDLDVYRRVLERNSNRLGAEEARTLLIAAGDGSAAESERLLIKLLTTAGITGWVVNRRQRVGGRLSIPDFTFERHRLVIELDGWAFHTDPERFERDRSRQNLYLVSGWLMLRFTWAQLTQEPEMVIATILAALRSRES